jgi:hypothetical protein
MGFISVKYDDLYSGFPNTPSIDESRLWRQQWLPLVGKEAAGGPRQVIGSATVAVLSRSA